MTKHIAHAHVPYKYHKLVRVHCSWCAYFCTSHPNDDSNQRTKKLAGLRIHGVNYLASTGNGWSIIQCRINI